MKLLSLQIDGFRGALSPVRVDFGTAFTVITGRNGSGKSTISDAVEYVLTGTLERFQLDTEKGERIEDYLWWRGSGSPKTQIVKLTFVDDFGREHTISRGPDSIDNHSGLNQLYDASQAPELALARLCQTSIIRDENITRFSTDMTETERFDFVDRIIGLSHGNVIEQRLVTLTKRLKQLVEQRHSEYERTRLEVGRITSELSQARVAVSGAAGIDLQNVIETLSALTGGKYSDLNSLIKATRDQISRTRSEVDLVEKLSAELRDIGPSQARRIELKRQLESQRTRVAALDADFKVSTDRLSSIEGALNAERVKSPSQEALAQLRVQGEKLGLQDGKCPLCGSEISADKFQAHLADIDEQLNVFNSGLSLLVRRHGEAKEEHDRLASELGKLNRYLENIALQSEQIEGEYRELQARASDLKLDSPSAFLDATQQRRERIQELEKNVSILQSSMALDRVTDLERQLEVAREKVTRADTDVSRASSAESFAREVEATLKRVGAEIVDERLSDLSPLLSELYLRLRPHTEWAEIQYLMRGDVRRFLSFNVGPDINPRFVFSSGQRRALGLSFLLAVHLSRKWCNLKTLMLDDPVQHIDDYRAMHLVEVLSSIRTLGWQVICAVEDSALADLLCRRLNIESSGEGVKVEMHFDNGKGISASCSDVVPLTPQALLSA